MKLLNLGSQLVRRQGLFLAFNAFQVAVVTALFANVFYIALHLLKPILGSGNDARSVILVDNLLNMETWRHGDVSAIRSAIESVPGVDNVSLGLGLPFSSAFSLRANLASDYGSVFAHGYQADNFATAMGVRLDQGADFAKSDVMPNAKMAFHARSILISQGVANRLFRGVDPVGKWIRLAINGHSYQYVVSGVAPITVPNPVVNEDNSNAFVLPDEPDEGPLIEAIVRANSKVPTALVKHNIAAKLLALNFPSYSYAKPKVRSLKEAKDEYFLGIKSVLFVLISVVAVALLVTYFSISSMSTLWVQRRKKEIGIRRCVGANVWDVVKLFSSELLFMQMVGILLGWLGAYYLNHVLRDSLGLSLLPLRLFFLGGTLAVVAGQTSCFLSNFRYLRMAPLAALRAS